MDRDEAGVNFSPDDPENVTIPESLGPVAWEFFGTIAYKVKKHENPAIMLECLECLRTIQNYNQTFLVNERRFEKIIFPSIRNYYLISDKTNLSYLELRILSEFCSILKSIKLDPTEPNKPFIENIKEFSRHVTGLLQNNEENDMIRNLKEDLKNFQNM